MENVKLTQEELEAIQKLKEKFSEAAYTLGVLQYQILDLTERKQDVEKELIAIRNKEQQIYKELTQKYGDVVFSLETGELVQN